MKNARLFALLLIPAWIFSSCEQATEEQERICLPQRMNATIVQGSRTEKIIADFHYKEDTEVLDRITWSNHQTHYFEYDEQGRIRVVRQVKVDKKVQEELWFHYDGALVNRIDRVEKNLDYVFLEPIDSTLVGYREFSYQGSLILEERYYSLTQNGHMELFEQKREYEYDSQGNILNALSTNIREKNSETVRLSYDKSKHPFSALQYYFSGESYVNNILTKSEAESGFDYSYDYELNAYNYPETIYEKLGAVNTRIIRYTYRFL